MKGYPSHLKVLKKAKKSIDIYVQKLKDNECKGEFVDMYKLIQRDFDDAIKLINKHQQSFDLN